MVARPAARTGRTANEAAMKKAEALGESAETSAAARALVLDLAGSDSGSAPNATAKLVMTTVRRSRALHFRLVIARVIVGLSVVKP